MARDEIARILRRLEKPVTPDPQFADRLYRGLAERLGAEDEAEPARRPQAVRPGRRWLVPAVVVASLAISAAVILPILVGGGPSDTRVVAEPTTVPPTVATTIPPGTTTEASGSTVATTVPPVDAVLAVNTIQFVGSLSSGPVAPSIQETGVAGAFVRMVLDGDGLPVLTYVDWNTGTIRVAHCEDAACAEPAAIRGVASLSGSIWGLELALDADGGSVVAYTEPVGEPGSEDLIVRLNLVRADGTHVLMAERSGPTLAGLYVGADGAPVVAYWRVVPFAGAELWLAACADSTCAVVEQRRVEAEGFEKWFEVRAFGVDGAGLPTWAVSDPNDRLFLLRCEDHGCTGEVTVIPLDAPAFEADLAFGPSGHPVVAYQSSPESFVGDPMQITICDDPECAAVSTASVDWAPEGAWAWTQGSLAGGLDVVVDDDGRPLAVWESANQIWIARCLDGACGEVKVAGTVARAERGWLAAAFGADGPLIAHFTGTDVAMLACADDLCTAPEVPAPETIDLGGPHWSTTTLASGVDHWWDAWEAVLSLDGEGHLVVPDETDDGIELFVREDDACTSARSITIPVGLAYFTAIVPPDGLPVAGADLEGSVVRCLDLDCETVEFNELEAPQEVWSDVGGDIAVGTGGRPVVAYPNFTQDAAPLTVASCNDAACANSTITRIDPTYGAFSRPEIAIDDNGRPVVAYLAWDEVRLAICADSACTDAAVTVLDSTGSGDDGPIGLAIGESGGPVVAFTDGARAVKLAVCADPDCSTFSVGAVDRAFQAWITGAGIGPDGNPLVAYVADGEAYLTVCETPDCGMFRTLWLEDVARDPYCGHAEFRFAVGRGGLPNVVQVVGDDDQPADLVVIHCNDPSCLEPREGEV